ncbi:MAG: hypothetical protein H7123_06025 [Thermoleophilia bacterium]|nr:hypothetical protein [Thermoleophilia bacterium]
MDADANAVKVTGGRRQRLALVLTAVAVLVIGIGAALLRTVGTPYRHIIPQWPVWIALGVLVFASVVAIVAHFYRPLRERVARLAFVELVEPSRSAMSVVSIAFMLAMTPSMFHARYFVDKQIERRPHDATLSGDLSIGFPKGLRWRVDALPTASVILARPETGYRLMALTPAYVVSSVPGHVANTPRNRIGERYDEVDKFFKEGASDEWRLKTMCDEHVDLFVADADDADAIAFAQRYPKVLRQVSNKRFFGFLVNSSNLSEGIRTLHGDPDRSTGITDKG